MEFGPRPSSIEVDFLVAGGQTPYSELIIPQSCLLIAIFASELVGKFWAFCSTAFSRLRCPVEASQLQSFLFTLLIMVRVVLVFYVLTNCSSVPA